MTSIAEQIANVELFVSALRAHRGSGTVTFRQVAAFGGMEHVISLVPDRAVEHAALRQSLERVPELMEAGPNHVLHGILTPSTDRLMTVGRDR